LPRRQPDPIERTGPDVPHGQANRVHLGGQVAAREPLRYSPGGVPILTLQLAHVSEQDEAGAPRQVALEIEAVAIGQTAVRLDAVSPGQRLTATGFLANRSRRSRRVVLHVNEFEID
jgi:primosomal replication protein N